MIISFQPAVIKASRLRSLVIAFGLTSCLLGAAINISAQKPELVPCKVGSNAASFGFSIWAPRSRIKVYLRTKDFGAEETDAVLAPLQSWNAVSNLTGSRVILEYAGQIDEQASCENCLTVMRGKATVRKGYDALANFRGLATHDEIIFSAAIVIEPRLKSLKALTDIMAHELGHSFGLRDCYSCKKQSTVMNQFDDFGTPNDLPAPSTCDIAQVAAAYRRAPAPVKVVPPIDEGEEPIDDDTPIVP